MQLADGDGEVISKEDVSLRTFIHWVYLPSADDRAPLSFVSEPQHQLLRNQT
jgi:hypothetical protein